MYSDFSSDRKNSSDKPNIFSKKMSLLIPMFLFAIVFISWLIYYPTVSQVSNKDMPIEDITSMPDASLSANPTESDSTAKNDTVLMDMVGKNFLDDDVSAMQDELEIRGINFYTEEVYSNSWDLWSIISQSVEPGTSLDTFSSILITLNCFLQARFAEKCKTFL